MHKLLTELAGARNTWRMMSYAKFNRLAGDIAECEWRRRDGTGITEI